MVGQQLRMEMNGSWRTTFLRKNKTDKLYKLNYVSLVSTLLAILAQMGDSAWTPFNSKL